MQNDGALTLVLSPHFKEPQRSSFPGNCKTNGHYFIFNITLNDYIPLCDFRQPTDSPYVELTAIVTGIQIQMELSREQVLEIYRKLY